MVSFDALLVVSFGGPEKHDDVIPFLENVLRGRNVPRERMLAVAEHYYHFDGRSPINDHNRELIADLFAQEKFDGVVHLAAQAGVRYSIKNPHAYVEANLVGFVNEDHYKEFCHPYLKRICDAFPADWVKLYHNDASIEACLEHLPDGDPRLGFTVRRQVPDGPVHEGQEDGFDRQV